VRNRRSDKFAYLGELDYREHQSFLDKSRKKPQQSYIWSLRHRVPDDLLRDLTLGGEARGKRGSHQYNGTRRPSTFDEYKKSYSYILDSADRTIIPAHHNYQVSLSRLLNELGVDSQFESSFVDVGFSFENVNFIGEIKVTTNLKLSDAFRLALGQLLEYAHLKYDVPPQMIMFLDQELDAPRLALATKLGVSVIVQQNNRYRLLNPNVAPVLQQLFL